LNKVPIIIGLGRTGFSLAKYLNKRHNNLYIYESSIENYYLEELKDLGINFELNPDLSEKTFKSISTIYPSPGVSKDHQVLKLASKLNVNIETDIDIYFENSRSFKVLVTGTNGKSTTVSMLEHLLKSFFIDLNIRAIGNIGRPVLSYLEEDLDIAIIEISSFQIEASSKLNSEIGILLNVHEDHMDRHKSIKEYQEIKRTILKYSDIKISDENNKILDKEFYNYKDYFPESFFLENTKLKKWPLHDVANLKASLVALLLILRKKGKDDSEDLDHFLNNAVRKISSFKRLEHRYEYLGQKNGIDFINDSKATNIDATLKAIESGSMNKEEGNIYLICGGDLKNQNFYKDKLLPFTVIKKCYVYGKDKKVLHDNLTPFTDVLLCDDLNSAFNNSINEAVSGDLILLSPACSSTDMFLDYKERGNQFKALVELL